MRLLVEKLPLFALAAVSCVVTVWAQGRPWQPVESFPLGWRIGNALSLTWPTSVSFSGRWGWQSYYPHPEVNLAAWKVVTAMLVLLLISGVVLAYWRRCPYLLVGWLWYLGMLVPVIGLVQVGLQARADRYTYLPQIGLCIALVWRAADVSRSWPYRRWACGVTSALMLGR